MSDTPLSTSFLQRNLACLRAALDDHNATCGNAPTGFLLHPYDRGVIPFDELWGVPLLPDPTRSVKRFVVGCAGHHREDEGPPLAGPDD